MHMADALLSPAVGATFWIASAGIIGYSARRITREQDDRKTPLMAVMGAFVFAAQMINFTIPGTGSSGHLGGGLLLAILLGPWRAFIAIASVLTVQALIFADGGLLALGCNIFNLGVFPAFVAYPFLWKPLAGKSPRSPRALLVALLAAIVGLQLGAFSVVLETVFSGVSDLPFSTFVAFMLPVHLAIGAVEGFVTWAVVAFVALMRPDIVSPDRKPASSMTALLGALAVVAVITGGVVSWFASSHPDGLEWSIGQVTGKEDVAGKEDGIHALLAKVQAKIALLPDYGFKGADGKTGEGTTVAGPVKAGTSVAGVAGVIIVLLIALTAGLIVRGKQAGGHKNGTP